MINLKNKKIGYYLVMAIAVLALALGIIFFATYKDAMANNAWGLVPETIGIFAFAGLALELVVIFLPQYALVHVGALVMFGVSFYKEVITIPNLIADEVNNVHYQGGSLPINIIYIVLQILIIALGIAVTFMGLYQDDKEEKEEFKAVKGTTNLVKLAVAGVVVVAAVLSSTLVTADLTKKANTGTGGNETSSKEEGPVWNPITDEIKAKADAFDYDFDPASVIIEKQDEYDYNDADLKALNATAATREGHHIVYYFEGSYAEGYQGDYSETYAQITLWDDGLFGGKAKDTTFKGFWYNRKGEETCLEMVSNVDRYESIIAETTSGFYEKQVYIYLNMGWGQRSIICGGYMYYPEVALFIDAGTNGEPLNFKVGQTYDRQSWVAKRVLKNLAYSSVFKASEVRWTDPAGMAADGKFAAAGDYEVKASWNGLEASINVHVEA